MLNFTGTLFPFKSSKQDYILIRFFATKLNYYTYNRFQGLQGLLNAKEAPLVRAWNLLVSATFLYFHLNPRSLIVETYSSGVPSATKPLVNWLELITVTFTYPFAGCALVLYYHAYGETILVSLDAACLRPAYNRRPFLRAQFARSLALFALGAVCFYAEQIFNAYNRERLTLLGKLSSTLYYYLFFNYLTMGLRIAHYLHYGIYFRLRQIAFKGGEGGSFKKVNLIRKCILLCKSLTITSQKVQRLYSLPFCLFLLVSLSDVVMSFVYIGLDFNLFDFTYVFFIFVYLTYMAYLNYLITLLLRRISTQDCWSKISKNKNKNLILVAGEIEYVYVNFLKIQLFNFITVDFTFICNLILFVLGYSLLIVQTNTM